MQVSGEMTGKVWDSAAARCAGLPCLFSFALPRCHVCEHVGEAIIRRQLASGTAFEDNAIVSVSTSGQEPVVGV